MKPVVLIVDDDSAFLRLTQKDMEAFRDSFSVVTAESGEAALEILEKDMVSVVVADLRMPAMDGFELLSGILKRFPDIPVCMMTSYDKPKTEEVVLKSGAAGYLKKPFSAIELFAQITKILNKKSDGGTLHNVTLETFLQLIEMEQQTSTLRIMDKRAKKAGVLFFRNGELMNARCGVIMGKDAAYEVLSWSNVSMTIEHDCVYQEKMIEGDLQAILLDAMRAKDEIEEDFEPEEEEDGEILLDTEFAHDDIPPPPPPPKPMAPPPPSPREAKPEPELSPIETIRMKIKKQFGAREGILNIASDPNWEGLIVQASTLGDAFGCGRLNALYVNREKEGQFIILPGKETIAISISPDSPWDRIVSILV